MPSTLVRVSEQTHEALRELAAQSGETMQAVLEKAVKEYQRQHFFEELNAGYAALRADPALWQDELEERAAWDATLPDGLEDDQAWPIQVAVRYGSWTWTQFAATNRAARGRP